MTKIIVYAKPNRMHVKWYQWT